MTRPSRKKPPNLRLVDGPTLLRVCGLCGESAKAMTRTECCGNLICDDEHEYVVFSYARNSCSRNHDRQTLCAFHHREEHSGDWRECAKCRAEFAPELFAWYATNPYNFDKLKDPPPFEPTLCDSCGQRIVLPRGGYSLSQGKYRCERCDSPPSSKKRSRPTRRGV